MISSLPCSASSTRVRTDSCAGVLDEAAGVDHHHPGLAFVGTHAIASLGQQSEHVLGIHPVLFAAQVAKATVGPDGGGA